MPELRYGLGANRYGYILTKFDVQGLSGLGHILLQTFVLSVCE